MLVQIRVELVVRSETDELSFAKGVGKEDLSSSFNPNFGVFHPFHVWYHVVVHSVPSAVERYPSDEKDEQHQEGKRSGEVDHFSGLFDTFPDAKVRNDPRKAKAEHHSPIHPAQIINTVCDHQHFVSKNMNLDQVQGNGKRQE